MAKKINKKPTDQQAKPKVNKALEGFEVSINSFGEIVSTKSIDEINAFLDEHLPDRKIKRKKDKPEQ
ncbi:MAG: hypothetical protein RMJ87_13750 [Cytophagales bacterium]|nr:hypothetical protein [Bernardetiaceae bacterium]MDW8206087.1 hypothetical protein [Cytophagales bacterium]